MKARCPAQMSGFTLLEVLVSTVLLSSVFVAVVALSSQALRNLNRMHPHELALSHAREKMDQLLLLEELNPGVSSGFWEDGYRWEVRITPSTYSPKAAPAGYALFDMRVAISWGDAPAEKSFVLETTQWARKAVPNAGH